MNNSFYGERHDSIDSDVGRTDNGAWNVWALQAEEQQRSDDDDDGHQRGVRRRFVKAQTG